MKPLMLSAICVFLIGDATSAAAQWGPGRPYRGLFGGGAGEAGQSLSVEMTLGAGWDDDVIAQATGVDPTASDGTRSSSFGAMTGSVNYSYARRRFALGASMGTSARLFASHLGGGYSTYSAGVGGSYGISRRTTFTADQRFSYQPFLSVVPFPALSDPVLGQAPPAQQELATADGAYFGGDSSVALAHQVSRRGSATVSYTFSKSDFTNDERRFSRQNAAARYAYALGKGLSARMGYGYSEAKYAIDEDRAIATGHSIDVGLDFDRALSLSRRTRLAFGTGSTAVQDHNQRHYVVTGNLRLTHQMGRSWAASATYDRSVQYSEAFDQPYLTNSVSASVGGLFHRRVQFTSTIGVSSGQVGLTTGVPFDAATAHTSIEVALCRFAALGAGHTYYRYFHRPGTSLDEIMPSELDRQSVGAYLTLWAPIFERTRRP